MVYLIWGLVGMGVVVGIALGATLGIRMDLGKMSDGTMLVGYTSEEDDGAHLFLNLDKEVNQLEDKDYIVLRVKKLKARK